MFYLSFTMADIGISFNPLWEYGSNVFANSKAMNFVSTYDVYNLIRMYCWASVSVGTQAKIAQQQELFLPTVDSFLALYKTKLNVSITKESLINLKNATKFRKQSKEEKDKKVARIPIPFGETARCAALAFMQNWRKYTGLYIGNLGTFACIH